MYITTTVIIILAFLTNGIICPGAGGGSVSEGGSSTSSSHHVNVSIFTGTLSWVGITFIIVVSFAILVCIMCCSICVAKRTPTSEQNEAEPVLGNSSENNITEQNPFQTGIWVFRYYQYNKWHGPYRLLLTFDHQLWKVNGKGADDVGSFICDGIYAPGNRQLNLTQRYDGDTGNPEENLGHASSLQLYWNSFRNVFEGKWHVRTPTYTDENKFEMEFKEHAEPLLKSQIITLRVEV